MEVDGKNKRLQLQQTGSNWCGKINRQEHMSCRSADILLIYHAKHCCCTDMLPKHYSVKNGSCRVQPHIPLIVKFDMSQDPRSMSQVQHIHPTREIKTNSPFKFLTKPNVPHELPAWNFCSWLWQVRHRCSEQLASKSTGNFIKNPLNECTTIHFLLPLNVSNQYAFIMKMKCDLC